MVAGIAASADQFSPDEADMTLKRKRSAFGESHMRTPLGFQRDSYRSQAHSQLPNNIGPTCRLDTILYDFATESRRRLTHGLSLTHVVGPAYPIFNSMINPADSASMQAHPLSQLLIEVLKGFSAISGLPEKVGVISEMFVFMRWYISPSVETFDAIPSFL